MNNIEKLQRLRSNLRHSPDFVSSRFKHCVERFNDRYHLTLTENEWEELNLALFLETNDCRYVQPGDTAESGLYIIRWRSQNIFVAYSETAYVILTAFPRHDRRFTAALNNRHDGFVPSPDMLAFRDEKRKIAEDFDQLIFNASGEMVLPDTLEAPSHSDPVAVINPMAEALAAFKPHPTISAKIASSFAAVDRTLIQRERELDHETHRNRGKIAELEAQIGKLQSHQSGFSTQVEYFKMQRAFAATTFDRLNAGEIDEASAHLIAEMMLTNLAAAGNSAVA